MKKFEIGKVYTSRCFGDHNLVDEFECVARTAKTVTFKSEYETIKREINITDDNEWAKNTSGFAFLRA